MKKNNACWIAIFLLYFTCVGITQAAESNINYIADINQLSQADQKAYYDIFQLNHEYSGMGDNPDKARKLIDYLVKKYPKNLYPITAYADYVLVIQRDQRLAYDIINKIFDSSPQSFNIVEARLISSELELNLEKNPKGAIETAKSALKLAPNNPTAMAMIGYTEKALGNFIESEKWLLKAIQNQKSPVRKANLLNGLGSLYIAQEAPDTKKAAEAWNAAARLAFDTAPWLLNDVAHLLYRHTDNYDEAIGYLEQALRLMKFNMAKINLGYAEYYKLSDSLAHPKKYINVSKPLSPEEIYTKTGMTPEHAFVHFSSQNLPILSRYLIEKGYVKDIDHYDDSDFSVETGEDGTALMFAITSQNIEYIKYLVNKGANVNAVDHESRTPIFQAALMQQEPKAKIKNNINIIKYLIAKGANVKVVDKAGRGIPYYVLGNSKDVLELLFLKGADPRAKDNDGVSLLGYAVKFNDLNAVKLLVDKYGGDPNSYVVPKAKISALAISAMRGEEGREIVKCLLDYGANTWVMLEGKDILVTLNDPVNSEVSGNAEIIKLITEARKNHARPKDFFTF